MSELWETNKIGLVGNIDNEYGIPEHWGKHGDSSQAGSTNLKMMGGPWCKYQTNFETGLWTARPVCLFQQNKVVLL